MAGKFLTRVHSKALLPRCFTKSTLTGLLLLLAMCASERSAQAGLRIELVPAYPDTSSARITGNINDLPSLTGDLINNGVYFYSMGNGGVSVPGYESIVVNSYFGSIRKRYSFRRITNNITCPTNAQAWRNYANSVLGSLTLPREGIYGDVGISLLSFHMTCSMVSNNIHYIMDVFVRSPGYDIEVINPPAPNSVCSLNGQNMSLDFNSTSLNVNGLSQSQNLNVSCTTGTAKDYNLRLTGSNVTDGRLNFGNGVSAQIYLNGTAVSANAATGIRLNGLTNRTVSVRGDLVGTASGAGVTNAYAVLILDAL